jgi:LacI family transcriptional regulator
MSKRSSTRHIAVIIDATRPYDRKIIGGVAAYMQEVGNWSLYVEEDPLEKLPDLRTWHGDGIIANLDDCRVAKAVYGLKMPLVGVGGGYGWYDPASRFPYVATANHKIARLAAEHFLDRGYRRLAFCGYPRTRINRWSEERCKAFVALARERGCSCSVHIGHRESARRWQALQRELMDWLRRLEKPVAVLGCNDSRARHVLEACRGLRLRVPEDVAVLGVDNDEMICELTSPPLSSIEQGARRIGYRAAAILDEWIGGKTPAELRYVVQPEGIAIRRSSDSLAIADPDISTAMHFIRNHASEGIGVDEVATAVGTSRSTLTRRFKEVMGCSILAEIDRVRMGRAKQLLATSDLPLKRVAVLSGFRYLSYFCRRFQQLSGQAPNEFRRQAKLK